MADALNGWEFTSTLGWRRIEIGWTAQDHEALYVGVGRDVNGDPYVDIDPQRKIQRGRSKGLWEGTRSAIHTREDYIAALGAIIEAGFRADWITPTKVADLMAVVEEWRESHE